MSLWQAALNQAEPIRVTLATTSVTTIVAEEDRKQAIGKIRVSNATGSPVAITLDAYDVANTTAYPLCTSKLVPANDAIEIYDDILQAGWSLRATAGAGSSALTVHVIYSVARS